MKAAELRQSILQAAVQGKLVPQNPQDEPASELLKRIQQEKTRLVKEGKLKKEKPLPPVAEDEIPFDLPEGWIWCRLGDLIYYSDAGKSPSCKNTPANTNETGVIKTTAVQCGKFLSHENKVLPTNFQIDNRMIIHIGDILITRAGPQNRTGIACLVEKCDYTLILSDKTVRLNCSGEFIYEPYIVAAINSLPIRNLLVEKMTGMAESQVNISQSNIAMILFPVPPLIEQRHIMSKVNELMTLCDALEAEERKLDALEAHFTEHLPKAILQAAVQGKLVPQNSHDESASELLKRIQQEKARLVKEGKLKKEKPLPPILEDEIPYDLPEGWVWCRLRDIGQIIGGATPDSHESSYYTKPGQGISWLTPADMTKYTQNNYISHGAKDITQAGYNSCSTTLMPPGSIIFSSRAPIGHIAFSGKEVCTNQGFKSVVPYMAAVAPWIFYALKSKVDDIQSRASGTTFKEVSGKFMESEIIPLPPLAEQQRITQKVDELIDLCNGLKDTYTAPMPPTKSDNIIPFPATQKEEETLLAARGDVGQLSNEAMQAIDDLFAEDEE